MSYCKICSKSFSYSTSILPYDICPKCYKENVTITEIQPTKEELINQYADMIVYLKDKNVKLLKEIQSNRDLIKHFRILFNEINKTKEG